MELESIIRELVYYPKKEQARKMVEFINEIDLSSNYMKILLTYGKTIKSMENEFATLNNEINSMNSNINNSMILTKEQQAKKELLHSKQMLLSQKMIEKGDIKQLMQLKYSYVAEEIKESEYKTKRDDLLTNIILTRANIYKTKEYIKKILNQNENINDDKEWYDRNGVYLEGNKRDNKTEGIDKLKSSREICDILQFCKNKKMSILPSNDDIKEIIAISICAPEYLVQKEMDMEQLDKNKTI